MAHLPLPVAEQIIAAADAVGESISALAGRILADAVKSGELERLTEAAAQVQQHMAAQVREQLAEVSSIVRAQVTQEEAE